MRTESYGLLVFSTLRHHALDLILQVAEDLDMRGLVLFGAGARVKP